MHFYFEDENKPTLKVDLIWWHFPYLWKHLNFIKPTDPENRNDFYAILEPEMVLLFIKHFKTKASEPGSIYTKFTLPNLIKRNIRDLNKGLKTTSLTKIVLTIHKWELV